MKNVFKNFWRKSNEKNILFNMGVVDVVKDAEATAIKVIGYVRGVVFVGSNVFITNYSDDDRESKVTRVKEIKINGHNVERAENCTAKLILEGIDDFEVKCGSVLHTRDVKDDDLYSSYTMSMVKSYIVNKKLILSDEEINAMNITDCAEVWRLFLHVQKNNPSILSDVSEQQVKERLAQVINGIVKKLLNVNEIYVVYSRATGEPFMFSNTFKEADDVYASTPPRVLIISKALVGRIRRLYTSEFFELRKVKSEEIPHLLYEVFCQNGADGILINSSELVIDKSKIITELNCRGLVSRDISVTNPELVKWLLLKGQLGKVISDEEVASWYVYHHFFSKAISTAKFLIPVKMKDGESLPFPDENGQAVLQDDLHLNMVLFEGKNKKKTVHMFTDKKRFDMIYSGYSALGMTISDIVDRFDCAINPTKYTAVGCYIDKDIYAEMISVSE